MVTSFKYIFILSRITWLIMPLGSLTFNFSVCYLLLVCLDYRYWWIFWNYAIWRYFYCFSCYNQTRDLIYKLYHRKLSSPYLIIDMRLLKGIHMHGDEPERWYGVGGRRGVYVWELMYTRGGFMSMYGKTIQYCKVK